METQKKWRIAGINFDHMHMGDLLRMAKDHPAVEVVGVSDEREQRLQWAIDNLQLEKHRTFSDYRQCMQETKPDVVILCPATAKHGEWTEKIAPFGVHIIMEKPFAATLAEADRMIAAVAKTGKQLAINWPIRWSRPHVTAKRICDEGVIGEVQQVHYYGGNRGPMRHVADKIAISEEDANREKSKSWFYQKAQGGGSMLDYMGYGTTFGTWYFDGKIPIEVTSVVNQPKGLEVDDHSLSIVRYDTGLSKFETRWGTFTDPWTVQPQPKCGFILVGKSGTLSAYDYEKTVRVQTREKPEGFDVPVDELKAPCRNPIEYFLDCLEKNIPVEGPLSPRISRIGQQIVDAAGRSAHENKTVQIVG